MSQVNDFAAIAAAQLDMMNSQDEIDSATTLVEIFSALAEKDYDGYDVPATVRVGTAKGIRSFILDYQVDCGWVPQMSHADACSIVFGGGNATGSFWDAALGILSALVFPCRFTADARERCQDLLNEIMAAA